jgi:hypothetical protein
MPAIKHQPKRVKEILIKYLETYRGNAQTHLKFLTDYGEYLRLPERALKRNVKKAQKKIKLATQLLDFLNSDT